MKTNIACFLCSKHIHGLEGVTYSCQSCAQRIFEPKQLGFLRIVQEKGELERQVQEALEGRAWRVQKTKEEILRVRMALHEAQKEEESAAAKVQDLRLRMKQLKSRNSTRRADLTLARSQLQHETSQTVQELSNSATRLRGRIFNAIQDAASARLYLIREMAAIYSFRERHFTQRPDVDYTIGREYLPIPSTESLAGLPHHVLNASMSHFCHFLLLMSGYLSVKLPCDIGWPEAVPWIKPREFQRKRPLGIPSKLERFMNEDTDRHILFLEGFAMLCYCVQYLCYVQGLTISHEEALDPGKAIYRLIIQKERTEGNPFTFGQANHASPSGYLATGKGWEKMEGWNEDGLYDIYALVKGIVMKEADWQVLGRSVEMEREWTKVGRRR